MNWTLSHRADAASRVLADRHYSRQKPGTVGFVPPGRCLVLRSLDGTAYWVTSWPFAEYVKHAWAGAWMCSAFRNEGSAIASELIRDAVSATCWFYGKSPELGMVTFIDRSKVRPSKRYGKLMWGYCYWRAGFKYVTNKSGKPVLTKGGLLVMRLPRWRMPEPEAPKGTQIGLAFAVGKK